MFKRMKLSHIEIIRTCSPLCTFVMIIKCLKPANYFI